MPNQSFFGGLQWLDIGRSGKISNFAKMRTIGFSGFSANPREIYRKSIAARKTGKKRQNPDFRRIFNKNQKKPIRKDRRKTIFSDNKGGTLDRGKNRRWRKKSARGRQNRANPPGCKNVQNRLLR